MTNLSILNQKEITMTSREIAELVGSRHDSVKKSVERLANRKDADGNPSPVIQLPPVVEVKNHLGQSVSEYIFTGEQGKRDSYVVVAQLSPEFTARLVDRWQELEKQTMPALPQTYAAALLEAGRLAAIAEEQAAQLALAAPKVEFVDKYVQSEGALGFRQVCKLLGVKEPEFRSFLYDTGIMYILGGQPTPKAQHIDAGRLIVKTGTSEGGYAFTTPKFTTKGVEWVAGEWAKYCLKRGF